MEYIKAPYRVATSSGAQKAYIRTVLLVLGSLVLLGVAALVYPVFYYTYVPKKLISVPVHLQYNAGQNPYGIISLSPDLKLDQAYDVSVDLTLPRSQANMGRGNFMVALYALKSAPTNPASLAFSSSWDPYAQVTEDNVVFSSRRSALIPYEDPLVSSVSRIVFLLYHMVFTRASSTLTLSVPMGERVSFLNAAARPRSLLVDVQAGQTLQVAASRVTLVARLTGARWLMYNHRILAFAGFTTLFWLAELVTVAFVWVVLGWVFSRRGHARTLIKRGVDERGGAIVADTTEYEDRPAWKDEGEDDDEVKVKYEEDSEPEKEKLPAMLRHMGDADDERDSDDGRKGAGTSFDQGMGGKVRRRVSRGGSS